MKVPFAKLPPALLAPRGAADVHACPSVHGCTAVCRARPSPAFQLGGTAHTVLEALTWALSTESPEPPLGVMTGYVDLLLPHVW